MLATIGVFFFWVLFGIGSLVAFVLGILLLLFLLTYKA